MARDVRRMGGPVLPTLLAATLVGCGSADRAPDRDAQADQPSPRASEPSPDRTSLAIAVENPAGGWHSYALTCDPGGGTIRCRSSPAGPWMRLTDPSEPVSVGAGQALLPAAVQPARRHHRDLAWG